MILGDVSGGGNGNAGSSTAGDPGSNAAASGPSAGGSALATGSAPAAGGPPIVAAPTPASALGTGGEAPKSWRDSLPDDLKADPTLGKYSDVSNLAKAHVELQKKFGQKGVFKPGEGASPEEIKAFREAMGIPTSPDKYDLGKFEGVKVDDSIVDWAKKLGAEQGIEPTAMKTLITDYMKISAENERLLDVQVQADMKAGIDSLRKEWGDSFDAGVQRANFAAEKLGGKELIERLVAFGAHNDPLILKAFNNAAKLYGEDKLREGGVGDGRVTPAELDSKIAAVQGRLFSMKQTDGAYMGLKNEYESLWRQKTGGK